MRLLPIVASLLALPGLAFAQSAVYDRFLTSSGIEIATGPDYVPKTVDQARGQAIWNNATAPNAGMPGVAGDSIPRNPSGNPVPVRATAPFPAAEVGKAVGRAGVQLGVKLASVIGVGITLYDLAKEIGYIIGRNPDGTLSVGKADPTVCSVAPCIEYDITVSAGGDGLYSSGWKYSKLAACQAWAVGASAQSPNWDFRTPRIALQAGVESCFTSMYRDSGSLYNDNAYMGTFTTRTVAAKPAVYNPSSMTDLENEIASKSGWPTNSKVHDLMKQDLATGGRPVTGPITVSGPASTPGTSKQVQKPDGTTETTNVTHNHNYAGNKVSTTTNTVINNYNPTTNTTTTTTTNETAAPSPPEPDVGATDTPLPDVPKLYTPLYPNGLTGVWTAKKAALLNTPLASVLPQLMPSVGSGGSCPSWMLNLSLGHWDYGSHDVAPPCYIWDWCKFFIIAGALLLARALIFGG